MTDEQLRARLARLDPATAPVDPITSPRAQDLLERTMITETTSTSRSRLPLLAAAAAAAVALGGGALMLAGEDAQDPATTLALTLPDPGAIASCLAFDVAVLREMPVAFAGTVTGREGDTVTLDVTRWYKGGDADVVTLDTPGSQTSASLDGVEFEKGKAYLVSATEGAVNGCGFSGEATAQFTASFDEAFK